MDKRTVRFDNHSYYTADMESLCREAKGHPKENVIELIASCGDKHATLLMNLAWKAGIGDSGGLPDSLYIVGFKQSRAVYTISGKTQIKHAIWAGFSGSYQDLGQRHKSIQIDKSIIQSAIAAIGGGKEKVAKVMLHDPGFKHSLCVLITCISEALRFRQVLEKVQHILLNEHACCQVSLTDFSKWDNRLPEC